MPIILDLSHRFLGIGASPLMFSRQCCHRAALKWHLEGLNSFKTQICTIPVDNIEGLLLKIRFYPLASSCDQKKPARIRSNCNIEGSLEGATRTPGGTAPPRSFWFLNYLIVFARSWTADLYHTAPVAPRNESRATTCRALHTRLA